MPKVGTTAVDAVTRAARILACAGWASAGFVSAASAAPITIYAAGSLSGVMQALIEASGQPAESFAKPVYGPAGMLGQRLQKGETADLFASADLAAPNRLAETRKDTLVVPFVRNRMCVAAKSSFRCRQAYGVQSLTRSPRAACSEATALRMIARSVCSSSSSTGRAMRPSITI